jgi:polyhydroxyalkanoate synthesis regulator phasin
MKQGKEVVMALSQRERAELEQNIRRIEKEIKDKEDILAYYKQEPSMKRHIPGLTSEITGLKQRLQWLKNALQKG